jgi:hypothetical protein
VRSVGDGWSPVDDWGSEPALRRMPYALATLPGEGGRLLVGLRGGVLLLTDDSGAGWSRLDIELPDVIDLAAATP